MNNGLSLGKALKNLRDEKGATQDDLAKLLNVKRQTYSAYERDVSLPDAKTLGVLADFFNVTSDCLLGREFKYSDAPASTGGVWVPVLGDVAAGIPIEAIEDIIDYEEIDLQTASRGEYFGLRICGDSMYPRISDGDVVIVRKQADVDSGDIAVAFIGNDTVTVKRIKKSPNGVMLVPNNPVYEPIFYSNQEVEELPIRILGKVVELRGKFK
jgi:repressor LexA